MLFAVLIGALGVVAVAAPTAGAQSDLALATIVPPNLSNTTTEYLTTIVMTGTDLPVAPAADMGKEIDNDFVSVVDATNGWTAGYGTGGFFHATCYVTLGASTSTQLILAVGNEGAACDDDYVHPGDTITVNLVAASGSVLGSASATAAPSSTTGVPVVSSVSPQDGPEGGGTTAAPGTGTVAVNTGSATAPEAFWFGGYSLLSGFYGVATTNFSADTTPGVYDVVPPSYVFGSATPQNYGVSVFAADSASGMSDQDCTLEIAGCADEYLYTDAYTGSTSLTIPGTGLNWSDALGSAGGTKDASNATTGCGVGGTAGVSAGLSVTGSLSGGPVDLSGGIDLSDSNSGIPEGFVGNATMTIENPLTITVGLAGGVSGCEEIGIPDLSIPDVGGLYFQVGGSITVAVNLTITIAAGTYSLNGGWIPGAKPFATLSESCKDAMGNPTTSCVSTQLTGSLTGSVSVAPLWLQLGPSVANVGAGLTAAAVITGTVTIDPWPPTATLDGDICVAGNWAAQVNIGAVNINDGGDWLGPFNIYGDGTLCPMGPTAAASTAAPGPPTGLTATPGDTTAALSWTPPSSDGGSAITGYNVYEGTTAGGESTTPVNTTPLAADATSYTATGLTDGTGYFFTVTAVNAVGESPASNEASATPTATAQVPGAPTGVTAQPGDTEATVSWSPPLTDGGSPVTGYNVFEGTSAGGESTTPVNATPLPAADTSYAPTGLLDGTTYFFTITAVNAVGESPASSEVSAIPTASASVPNPPIDLTAAAGDTTAVLSWSPPAQVGGSAITGYNVYDATTSGDEAATPLNSTPLAAGATSYTATGLTNGTPYYFVVKAANALGESPASTQATATPTASAQPPGAPTGVTATPGDTTDGLSWTAPTSDGGSAITGYDVYEGTAAGGESTTPVNASPLAADASTYTATDLTDGTTYYFTVKAINAVGESPPSAEVSATPTATAKVPGAPTGLAASPGDTTAVVSWSASTSDGGSAITGYNIYEGTAAGGESTTPVNASPLAADASTYTATDLTDGTTYYFTVKAINAVGESPPSAEVSATPTATAKVPGAPTGLAASPGDTTAVVSWSAPTSDGGTAITGYNIYESTTAGDESPVSSSPLAADTRSDTLYGLTNGTKYYFDVKAVNAVGEGPPSDEVSATPTSAPTSPGVPTAVSAQPGDAAAMLSWSPPAFDGGSALTGYNVYEGTVAAGESTTPVNSTPLAADATGLSVTGLTNGTRYYFTVTAVNAVGASPASVEVSVMPTASATAPSAPTSVSAEPGDSRAVVLWSPPASDGGSAITGYNVYLGLSAGGESTTPLNTSLLPADAIGVTVTGLTNDTTYYFTITAVNAVGESPASAEVMVTPIRTAAAVPNPPRHPTITAHRTSVLVAWLPPTYDGGSPITGYNVYEGTAAGAESTTPVNSSPIPVTKTQYRVTQLTDGTLYWFVVRAISADGISPPSAEVAAVPNPPGLAEAIAHNGSVKALWSGPSPVRGPTIIGYEVLVGTARGEESATSVNTPLVTRRSLPSTVVTW